MLLSCRQKKQTSTGRGPQNCVYGNEAAASLFSTPFGKVAKHSIQPNLCKQMPHVTPKFWCDYLCSRRGTSQVDQPTKSRADSPVVDCVASVSAVHDLQSVEERGGCCSGGRRNSTGPGGWCVCYSAAALTCTPQQKCSHKLVQSKRQAALPDWQMPPAQQRLHVWPLISTIGKQPSDKNSIIP